MSKTTSPSRPHSPPPSSSTASPSHSHLHLHSHGSPNGIKSLGRRVSHSKPVRMLKNIASRASMSSHGRRRSSSSVHSGRSNNSDPDSTARDASDVPDVPDIKDVKDVRDSATQTHDNTRKTLEVQEEVKEGHGSPSAVPSTAPVGQITDNMLTVPGAASELHGNSAASPLPGEDAQPSDRVEVEVADGVNSTQDGHEEEARLEVGVESGITSDTLCVESREDAEKTETTPSALGDSIVVVVVPPIDDDNIVDSNKQAKMESEHKQQEQLTAEQLANVDPFIVADPEEAVSDLGSDGKEQPSTVASASASSPPPLPDAHLASASSFTAEYKSTEDSQLELAQPSPTASSDSVHSEEEAPELYTPTLTISSLFLPIPNADPLTSLLIKHIPEHTLRPPRDISGEWQHTDFHTLVMTNSWRALARMARDNIVSANPRDVELILNLWYIRLSSLARLRLFNQTIAEYENLFNALTTISPPAARSYVLTRLLPFELEVLRARCAYWAGDHAGYLDDTSALLRRCRVRARASRDPDEQSMWRERGARISLIIASQLVEMKDFTAATALLEPLLTSGSSFSPTGSPSPVLRSAIARIYLQGGNLAAARAHITLVEADEAADMPLKVMNAVVLAAAEGDWPTAAEHARKLVDIELADVAAVNDLAVALLAMGNVKEGIQLLEQTLQAYPSAATTTEPYLFNLSTMYELRAALTTHKKRDLLIEVAKWSGDGLRTACLKLNS